MGLPRRERIYHRIRSEPGQFLKGLAEMEQTASATIMWHIKYLEAAELVWSEHYWSQRIFHARIHGKPGRDRGRWETIMRSPGPRQLWSWANESPDVCWVKGSRDLHVGRERMERAIEDLQSLGALRVGQTGPCAHGCKTLHPLSPPPLPPELQ